MSRPSDHSRLVRGLLGFAAVQAVAIAAMVAPALGSKQWIEAPPRSPAPIQRQLLPASELDILRDGATLGDRTAGPLLVTQLLDNYERTRDTDNLFEALHWIDRGWSAGVYQDSGLASRVFERHCDHKVLRWHWLCSAGE
jgi:hypothetical protein